MIEKYEITIDRPKACSITYLKNYMIIALQQWREGDYEDDPLMCHDLNIKIKRIKNEKL